MDQKIKKKIVEASQFARRLKGESLKLLAERQNELNVFLSWISK